MGWLDEALLVAESEPVLRRAYKEKLARLAITDQRSQIAELMEKAAAKLTSPESAEEMGGWKQWLDIMAKEYDGMQQNVVTQQKYDRIAELQRRLERAEKSGNSEAVARYQRLINESAQPASEQKPAN